MEKKDRWKAAVVTLSDKGYAGLREDKSGPLVCEILTKAGYEVCRQILLPDEKEEIEVCLRRLCDEDEMNLVVTTGGTGFAPRDCTPEATLAVAEKNVPGIAEAMRLASLRITDRAMLSRGVSVIRGKTLIINLPGSPKAAGENLEAVLSPLEHGLAILIGKAGECGHPMPDRNRGESCQGTR